MKKLLLNLLIHCLALPLFAQGNLGIDTTYEELVYEDCYHCILKDSLPLSKGQVYLWEDANEYFYFSVDKDTLRGLFAGLEDVSIDSISLVDFSLDGQEELLVHYSFTNGRSDWNGGTREQWTLLAIYDLAKRRIIYQDYIQSDYENWENILEKPLNQLAYGEEPKVIDKEVYSRECFVYSYRIKEGILTLTKQIDSPCKGDEGEEKVPNKQVLLYTPTELLYQN